MDALPPTLPFALSRAYGSGVTPVRPVTAAHGAAPVANVNPGVDRGPSFADRLAAAVVPGRVNFDGPTPQPSVQNGSIAFYRRPGDLNAAATAIALGRTLDVQG
ncbi:MAG: hypothetical protein ACT4PL_13580 [Phycisphaerales bacterium]